jgi:hypothetical protein
VSGKDRIVRHFKQRYRTARGYERFLDLLVIGVRLAVYFVQTLVFG